ncbi:HlyD family efflux transporter periplasmic adaptor subunit [Pseudoalteromonas sp. CO348]|uniref:efflux RND transporter periplasmic adaptor subunit n=1 Tax=Pseudoalteromonas sp. CO348 TaxID=1777271 RepID=UPI001022D19F|nr:HlyD family efflux transporter periplasmic adaptor subunit [Pseudoalteromonas sp. CO348]RZG04530.1 HlyD family efflux transporter periplasmic adaptor subunit [Pseudoalteromonas sp. CO348]
MDIHTSLAKTAKKPFRRWWLLTTLIVLAAMGVWMVPHDQQIDAEMLKFATVQSGPIQFSVKGYGRLRSKISREITTAFAAQVETVLHLPGSRVAPDTVILQLTNPELTQQLHRERLVLARQKANVEALRLSQESERLVLKGQNTLLSSELENAKLREQAERQLVTQGIVSSLDHQRSILTVAQLSERVKLAQQQLSQTSALHKQRIEIELELLKEYELSYQVALQAVEQLQVTAGISGMLQQVHVSQGQAITRGEALAVVGSERTLVADLLVPEREASEIILGQRALVDTFVGQVEAKVSRIVPIVQDGRIAIELTLLGELPSNARPLLTVEGQIFTAKKTAALSLIKPPRATPQSQSQLFVLDKQNNMLIKKSFKFGKLAGNAIEVLEGGLSGEQVVVSEMSDYQHLEKITIKSLNR